jgi:hypothetical protein
LHQLSPHNI